MALYRTISMSFWTDSKVVDEFTPEDRYFYLYLFTNPHTNLCGCYEISIRQMANELGYAKDSVENLIKRFESVHNVIRYSSVGKEILLLNWYKYNWTKSEKFRVPLIKEIEQVKDEYPNEERAQIESLVMSGIQYLVEMATGVVKGTVGAEGATGATGATGA